jgi:hypothetical protein
MSKEIFKNITNSIEIIEEMSINKFKINIEIFRKILELVGDKEDKYYEEFFNINIKEFKLKNNYVINYNIFNINKLINFNNFKNIYEFIEIIKYYFSNELLIEIKNLLDNIFITPPSSPIIKINLKSSIPEPLKLSIPEPPKSSIPEPQLIKYKKKAIPIALKIQVWNKWIGEEIGKHKCLCCKNTDIIQMSFHCGHIIAESKGGETNLSNLKPICQNCNSSMGSQNMNDFMKTFI